MPRGEGTGEGIVREFGTDMYTAAVFKADDQQGPAGQHGGFAQCYVAAGRQVWGDWIHVCTAELLCCLPETMTTLLIIMPILSR